MILNFRRAPDAGLSISRYHALASQYDRACRYIDAIRTHAIDALEIEEGDTVFDIACGTGATLCVLADRVGPGGLAVGIEHCPSMVALARQRVHAAGSADRVL